MISSNENDFGCRMEDRARMSETAIDQRIIESAQKLISPNQESIDFLNELSNFSSIFGNCTPEIINQLKSMKFECFLLQLLENHQNPFIIQQALSCIYTWISNFTDINLVFFNSDFALMISSFALSPELKDQRACRLSFEILKTICGFSPKCIPHLIKSGIIKNLVIFYLNCTEDLIQKEILCTLYFIIKPIQVSFEDISGIAPIFQKILSESQSSNIDPAFVLASAFADHGEHFCLLLIECMPFEQLFISFKNFSNDEQASFLRLLISIFDYSSFIDLANIVGLFKWEDILSFIDRPNNNLIKEYFAKFLSSAFQKYPMLITSAYEAKVFQLLLLWTEVEQHSIQTRALIALLKAFSYAISTIGIFLLESGLLRKMADQLDFDSEFLTKEICKAVIILYNYADKNGKENLCQTLNVQYVSEILEALENEEELPSDLCGAVKESLGEIEDGRLWV